MLVGLLGRTISSPDAINTVSLVVTNDQATYLIKRPQDFIRAEIPDLIRLAQAGDLTELYRRGRIQIAPGRAAPPLEPGYNFNINRWSLYAPVSTYFLPINELTAFYINALLEVFDETMGLFIPDERANFRPATIAYCEYLYARYGRFPAYSAPFRTVLGYQASHVDADFYQRFYRPEALTETQGQHLAGWHLDREIL
jgi:hypothetical protein